ncbi:MAG: citrulline utilization hydrolase CtlX [Candidatus Limnocylindrus sp.]
MNQSPHAVLMINPLGFNPNPETAVDNAFQDSEIVDATERAAVAAEARVEVARIAEGLRGLGVEVLLIDDLPGSDVPDSVFPNNWISTHEDGRIVLYPMATPSRRRERRADVVEALRARYLVSDVIDLSAMEQDALYLEGTGALVLDHVNRVAYVARSGRAHTAAALRWCSAMEYDAEIFDTVDAHGAPIYHTNVVLSIASEFVTAGLENIPDPTERARVLARLTASGREVVALDPAQVAEFAGNGLELVGADGRRIFALSARAAAALRADQRAQIERFAHVFPISIPTIERSGGSVRCTLAGIHLPPRGAAGG